MKTWVVYASPLILLGKIGRLDLLDELAPHFVIPAAVSVELLAGPDHDPAKVWIRGRDSVHVVPDVSAPPQILAWDLGAGETAVLAIASSLPDCICVLDDRAARTCAGVFQIPVIGTLGILLKAKAGGLIPMLRPVIDELVAVGSQLSPLVIQRALALAGEHP